MTTRTPVNTVASASSLAALEQKKRELQVAARKGANWLFWIAGLSVINSVISVINVNGMPNYVLGLATGNLVGGMAIGIAQTLGVADWGVGVRLIFQSFNVLFAGLFAMMGILAAKQYRWVIIVGLALYASDAMTYMVYGDLLSIAIHGVALWGLWQGTQALITLRRLERNSASPNPS
jgi:hypothetical protein